MNRPRVLTVGAVLTAALLALPAALAAQGDPPPRGNAGANLPTGGGHASGGGGGATAVSRGDVGGSSGGSSGGSTGSSWSGGNASGGGGIANWGDGGRRNAVVRGPAGENRRSGGSSGSGGSDEGRVAPWYSRSREGRPIVGTAAGRDEVQRPAPGGGVGYWGRQDYYGDYYYGYGYPGYYGNGWYGNCRSMFGFGSFGLGYFYYDPGWWSYAGAYGSPYGGCYPYGSYGHWGGTFSGGGGGGGSYSPSSANAGLKIKVKPTNAQVFVDGYFAGEVGEFDGVFQRLPLTAGEHRIEIRAPGYEALTFDVTVEPYQVINYKGELKRQ